MSETPYIQGISDDQLDRMIIRRTNAVQEYIRAGDFHMATRLCVHLVRAKQERKRRNESERGNNE